MENEFRWTTARALRELVARRSASPLEIVEACLATIGELDPVLRAFITVAADRAIDEARSAAEAVARGVPLGPLHGVPVALKDEAWTADMPSTAGSLIFKRFVPSRDGTVAERLRRAGAIIVGKANMPEFAAWPRSKNRIAGESVNPWDTRRISGASSGGSAAAVVAGMVPLAVGSDGGGSIRIPSALCGAVGLYPSPGRVPSYGSFSYTPAGSMGPMGRDVADVALMQQVIAGPDSRDASAMTEEAPEVLAGLDSGVEGLRAVWSSDFGRIPVDSRVAAVAAEALMELSRAGVSIEETEAVLEHPWGDAAAITADQDAVAAAGWPTEVPYDETDIPDLSAEEEWMWEVFSDTVPFTASESFQQLRARYVPLLTPPAQVAARGPAPAAAAPPPSAESLRRAMEAVLSDRDVLCSPTMAVTAPVAPEGWGTAYADGYMGTNFTFIANALGCAAISVPCGLVDGLPVGLQFIGRPGDEAKVLRFARALEVIRPFPTLRHHTDA